MDLSQYERSSGKKFFGLAFVIGLHVLIVYALLTGLARKAVEVIKRPIETKIVEEVKPPPPPDVPPPPPPPKLVAPPPPFIPPPEVRIAQPPPQNTIQAVTTVKPESPVLPPPAPPVPAAPPAVATGPSRVAAVVDMNTCEKPTYPISARRNQEQGRVLLQFLIGVDGRVMDAKVEKSSGSRALDSAARTALSLCRFKLGMADGKPEQSWSRVEYVWRLTD
ncbi:MAG: periplasmic protein TonB [Burkholderiales bacterium]